MSRFLVVRLAIGWLFVNLLSCQSSHNRLNPQAPKEAYNTTEMEVRNERFLSTVHVPVSIALEDVERQINAQVNGLIYEDNSLEDNNNDNFMTKVWKRGTIIVNAQDSLFHFVVPLKIWAKAGVSVLGFTQYKETEFEIDLRFKTKFDLERDWSVHTQTQGDGYGWVRRPTVSFVGLNIPITNIVGRLIDKNLSSITKTLDQQIRRNVDLRTPVLKAWNTLREPYLVSEKYRTYLQVVPKTYSDHTAPLRRTDYPVYDWYRRLYPHDNGRKNLDVRPAVFIARSDRCAAGERRFPDWTAQ